MAGSEQPLTAARLRGERAHRGGRRRADGLLGTLGLTLLGALLPGTGIAWTGRRVLGSLVLLAALGAGAAGYWYAGRDLDAVLELVFDPVRLQVFAGVLATAYALWILVVVATYLLVRPAERPRWHSVVGVGFVLALVVGVAAPVALGTRYATVQADLVEEVFEDNRSATAPVVISKADPWAGTDRVNVLLVGGDGGVNRWGVRTDSMILASMNTVTGRTVLFSLPRNLMYARFPVGSPLQALYPDGFRGYGDPAAYMLNAVYGQVPALHPGVLGESDNEGADALKQAVGGSLGLEVDYYLLVNLQGFKQIVDAMGGVTVNINEPVAIGGNTDLGIPPEDYLMPGPDQRLDGHEALWYSRGRYGSDDYERMERQRCMVDAIIAEAKPLNLLRRYQALAAAGKEIVRTDIPSDLLPAFVDLALRVKDGEVASVAFVSSERFFPGNPDYDWMREVVQKAITPPPPVPEPADPTPSESTSPSPSPSPTENPTLEPSPSPWPDEEPEPGDAVVAADACAYRPEAS